MKRREILRKTGAGLVASTAIVGVAGARTGNETVARKEVSAAATSVLADHEDLLAELVNEGLLDRNDLDVRETDLTTTTTSLDGTETWLAGFSRTVERGELFVHVLPEVDLAYATLEGEDGTVEAYGDGVSPNGCSGCYYELCYCAEPGCDPYECCEVICTCQPGCGCGGPCPT